MRLVAKLMRVEAIQNVEVGPDDAALQRKSLTGRFPVLEDTEQGGLLICDALPIARYLSRDDALFCNGNSVQQSKFNIKS